MIIVIIVISRHWLLGVLLGGDTSMQLAAAVTMCKAAWGGGKGRRQRSQFLSADSGDYWHFLTLLSFYRYFKLNKAMRRM